MSIKVENVSKLYGDQLALDQVNFNIDNGEIVGFLGPNGAGKSTIMKIITGYLPATSGNVSVCGSDVEMDDQFTKSKIGYLPEHNPLYLEMYVKEYLTFCARIHKIKDIKSRVDEIILETGLDSEQNKKIQQLSKGYRQRVGIAQALIHNPDVLILDEPTTGLDPNQLEEIRSLIKHVGKSKTVMLSTHIMQEVEAICSRVIIINNGLIVKDASIDSLQDKTQIIFDVEFSEPLNEKNFKKDLNLNIERLNQNNYLIKSNGNDSREIEKLIFNWSVGNDLIIRKIQKKESNLEDVFKQLTKFKQ